MRDNALVARWNDGEELREIFALPAGGGAAVVCRTAGGLTGEIFDAPWREARVFVREDDMAAFLRVLAGPLGARPAEGELSQGERLRAAAQVFFAGEETQLSDLLSALDGAGVTYEYRTSAFCDAVSLGNAPRAA